MNHLRIYMIWVTQSDSSKNPKIDDRIKCIERIVFGYATQISRSEASKNPRPAKSPSSEKFKNPGSAKLALSEFPNIRRGSVVPDVLYIITSMTCATGFTTHAWGSSICQHARQNRPSIELPSQRKRAPKTTFMESTRTVCLSTERVFQKGSLPFKRYHWTDKIRMFGTAELLGKATNFEQA